MLRILCLHGYSLSAKMMRDHMATIVAALEGKASFTFLEAPLTVQFVPDNHFPALPAGEQARSWYKPLRNDSGDVIGYEGLDEAISMLREADEAEEQRHGAGFDCVWGFSQGGALAALAVGLRDGTHAQILPPPLRSLKCAVFSSSVYRWPDVERFSAAFPPAAAPFTLPSLHCFGAADDQVPAEHFTRLAGSFAVDANRVVHEHPGDHYVANDPASIAVYMEWVEAQLQVATAATSCATTNSKGGDDASS